MVEKREPQPIHEYLETPGPLRRLARRLAGLGGDFRTAESGRSLDRLLAAPGPLVSVGGGPVRMDSRLVNLNLAPYRNVDVVATAYRLPFDSGSLGGVHCEAVIEHLEFPDRAVAEMVRVLRNGGLVYSCTPFLQAFHGYPSHYQNFTLEGHKRLFERAGLKVLTCGTAVGPGFMLSDLASLYLRNYAPGPARALSLLFRIGALPLRALDRLLWTEPRSHELASTTYVLASK